VVVETWPTRELPILRAALEQLDAGASKVDLEAVKKEYGLG
jgi:hypothetical protein